jgi:hypothetical protein
MFWKVTCQELKTLVSFPDPTLGTLKHFLGLAHHHVTARAPTQTYANNHMIAELAETKISANILRPFPRMQGGVWERENIDQ